MFEIMTATGDELINHLISSKELKQVNLQEVMTSFSMDIVAYVFFNCKYF